MHQAYIGLGSNLGDRIGNCREALRRLTGQGAIRIVVQSSLYETEPVGPVPQPWFINLAADVQTSLDAPGLLRVLLDTERAMGRRRETETPQGPRVIDLDLLLFDEVIRTEPDLTLPHPRMHLRRFVLEPLAEIAPGVREPRSGLTVRELRDRLTDPAIVRRLAASQVSNTP